MKRYATNYVVLREKKNFMEDSLREFGQRLKALRKAKGLKQIEMAELMDCLLYTSRCV